MNFPKKHIADVIEQNRLAEERRINAEYDRHASNINSETNDNISKLNKQISDNRKGNGATFTSVFSCVGLLVGFFICVSKCNSDASFFDAVGMWLLMLIIGAAVGFILDKIAGGAAKADTKSCESKITYYNENRENLLKDNQHSRETVLAANNDDHRRKAENYQRMFDAAVERYKLEMNNRTDPIYVERMDDLVADLGNILANCIKTSFAMIDRDPSGDYVNQFVTENLSFHVYSHGIALQAGSNSFAFAEKGLLALETDEETFARAAIIAERVVSYVQGLPSEAMDISGREYAPGRLVSLSLIDDMYNGGNRFNWEIYDNRYDVAGAAYVKVVITCRCVNSKYAPPV
ncbi:MAG: hypothetical protein IJ017_01275 [Oscillospiraceae bacterium]|nr:hypothetical protein [Oscillospiraceae bacterium]